MQRTFRPKIKLTKLMGPFCVESSFDMSDLMRPSRSRQHMAYPPMQWPHPSIKRRHQRIAVPSPPGFLRQKDPSHCPKWFFAILSNPYGYYKLRPSIFSPGPGSLGGYFILVKRLRLQPVVQAAALPRESSCEKRQPFMCRSLLFTC